MILRTLGSLAMINTVIILEGSGDLTFIKWLLNKSAICLPSNVRLIEVKGKPQFKPYIENFIIRGVNDAKNAIDYSDYEVKKVLVIKDFDLDDMSNELLELYAPLKNIGVHFEKYYISGTDPAPRTLETLFIENDGELLRSFVKLIKTFNQNRQNENKELLENVNDKFLFHEFFKFVGEKSKFSEEFFDCVFNDDKFLTFPDIKNLITKIQEFIKD